MTIEQLLSLEEGKTLEFKENSLSSQNIAKTIIAFSNTAGGTLLLGVQDGDKRIIGIDDPIKEVEKIANIINDCIAPKIAPNIDIVSYRNKSLVQVQVYPGANKPYHLKTAILPHGVYYRIGSTNREADHTMIEELKRSVTNKFFDETPMVDLNSEEIDFRVASEFFENKKILTEKDLQTLELIVSSQGRQVPTVGGIILFSPRRETFFPDCWIQAGRFLGTTKTEIMDSVEIHDYPITSIERGLDFVKKHSMLAYKIEGLQRAEQWSIPLKAVREALVNAYAHMDYSQAGAPIRISIFDDRLEIENPGLLPFGLTINDIIEGVSKIRNKVIVQVLHKLGYIERWGLGINRIMESCTNAGLPLPEFKEIANRFRVTIFTKRVEPLKQDKIDQDIIRVIKDCGGLSTADVAAKVGLSTRAVRDRLKNLVELHLLYVVGTGSHDPHKKFKVR
jgi:predicted HTH transcriptional regulator